MDKKNSKKKKDKKKGGEIRTRFAPSPTGFVHVGNLRTVLYSYLMAKKNKGSFLLRVEDTDQDRRVEGAMEKMLESLRWVGIEPDEGVLLDKDGKVQQKGEHGPYIQSERLKIYQEHVLGLLSKGKVYHCFCTENRLKELREEQQKNKQAPKYDGFCRNLSKEEKDEKIKNGKDYVIRLKVPKNETIEFKDEVFGKIKIDSNTIDDQVLLKSDGFPTYHLAVVVDDHLMDITHITRGEDWLPSTPKHVLLYQAFGWEIPTIIHLPNVLGQNGKKLSKREGDVGVEDFRRKGYLPEALINFLALLGWNPKTEQEHFSLNELVKKFDVNGLHKAGAVFDYKKLDWMNSHYIKQKDDAALFGLCRPYLKKYLEENKFSAADELLQKIVTIEKERIKKLSEIIDDINYYFTEPKYEKEMLWWKKMTDEELEKSLKQSLEVLKKLKEKDYTIEKLQEKLFEAAGDKKGELLWPLRVALTGEEKSPSPFEVAWILGKEKATKRVKNALKLVQK